MVKIEDKKSEKDELVTKKYLDSKLSCLDKKFDDKFEYLDKKIDKVIHYMNLKFESIEEKLIKLDSINTGLERIAKTLDWLVGKYKKFDEEHVILSEQNERINNRLDIHEDRISGLEQRTISP